MAASPVSRVLGAAAIVALAGVLAGVSRPAAQTQSSMADLIGQYAEWVDGRRPSVDLGAADLDVVRRELGRLDPAAIPVDDALSPEQAREARRRVLTAFALEVAAVGSTRHASSAARLVEWACAYVRTHTPINEFDSAWQLAALSVLEGGIDWRTLNDHVTHARPIFRDEPRLLLARAIVDEQFNAPAEVLVRSETAAGLQRSREAIARAEGEAARASERAILHFQEAAQEPSVRAEATLRGGHVLLRLSRFDAALTAWSRDVEHETDDRALLFLLHLFRGIAHEGRGRYAESRSAYEEALRISPGAHSATMRLAALAFRYGVGDDPSPLSDALLRNDDPRRDPWWSYYAADWRLYYAQIARVRTLVKGTKAGTGPGHER